MSRESPGPAMFELQAPNEILARILYHFVDEDHSPVILTRVCHLWRQLALSTSSLWNIVDLWSLKQAKHHLHLAQHQPLVVIWRLRGWMTQPMELVEYEWILSQSCRFLQLSVKRYDSNTAALLGHLGNTLSQLQHLSIEHEGGLYFTEDICLFRSMPNLRTLILAAVNIDGSNFKDTLRNSPLLETLDLFCVTVISPGPEVGSTSGPVELPYLKFFTMTLVTREDQGYFVASISPPKECELHIDTEIWAHLASDSMLHPTTTATLSPVTFTTVHLLQHVIVYTEDLNTSRCKLKLEIRTGVVEDVPQDAIALHDFNHTFIATLRIDAVQVLDSPYVHRLLARVLPHIRTLEIQSHVLQKLWTSRQGFTLFSRVSQLETLVIEDGILDTDSQIGLENIRAVRAFAKQIMKRSEALKLKLRRCETNPQGLHMLEDV